MVSPTHTLLRVYLQCLSLAPCAMYIHISVVLVRCFIIMGNNYGNGSADWNILLPIRIFLRV